MICHNAHQTINFFGTECPLCAEIKRREDVEAIYRKLEGAAYTSVSHIEREALLQHDLPGQPRLEKIG